MWLSRSIRVIAEGKRRIILVAPTGAGKTVIGAAIIENARANERRVLLLAHTREIIKQSSEKLFAQEINHGVTLAGFTTRPYEPVQVASIQTLHARAIRSQRMELPPADLILVDECHHAPANSYRRIISAYPDAIIVGLTATPCRGDGRGLGGIFEAMVECPQVAELIKQKYLVRTIVFAPVNPDLKGVETRAGDYVEAQLAELIDRAGLVGDTVTHWHKYGERRRTVCFATSVAHSIHIRDEFIKAGVRAEHVDGALPKLERDAILARLASGDLDLITNCMVLTEGWDMPEVSCCILVRPTKKMGLYRQMVGRVLRPAPGKTNAIILDHSGAVFRHGFVEDHVEWQLDPDKRSVSPNHVAGNKRGYSSRLLECSQCRAIRVAGERCQHCGYLPQRRGNAADFVHGDLALVDRQHRTAQAISDPNERMRWHAELTWIAAKHAYKAGWAAHMFREKFGTWPATRHIRPMQPSPEVLSWVRSRNIAFAKAKAKRAAA